MRDKYVREAVVHLHCNVMHLRAVFLKIEAMNILRENDNRDATTILTPKGYFKLWKCTLVEEILRIGNRVFNFHVTFE